MSAGGERLLHDGLGSTAARMTSSGLASFRYDAWGGYQGTDKPESGAPSTGFTGHSFDADTNLVYAQQRWYSPSQGRFLSMDPASGDPFKPGSLQPWLYANGSPTGRVDPDGTTAVMAGGYCPESPGGRCPFSTRMSLMADDIGTGAGMAYDGYKGAVGWAGHGVESAGNTVGDWGLWLGTDWDGNVSPGGYTAGFMASTAVKFAGGIPVGIFGIGLLPEWVANSPSEYQSGKRQFLRGVGQGQFDTSALGVGRMSGVVGGWAGLAAGGLRRAPPAVEILPAEAGFRRSLPPGQRALRPSEMVVEGTVISRSTDLSASERLLLPSGEGAVALLSEGVSSANNVLIDNNILSHFVKGDVDAAAFMDRYRGALSIDHRVEWEFMRAAENGLPGRTRMNLERLKKEYGIQLLRTPSSYDEALAAMKAAEQTIVVNDHYIVAGAMKYGLRFATGDVRALKTAVFNGVDAKYFNFESKLSDYKARYGKATGMLEQKGFDVKRHIGPLGPW
ncbi:MAG: PIN domain-containing protein [Myxococcaceae bacterium]|nr:MAG: PIN domain-containing protein [Myxococcaceae bacterium]